ncbi:uncharacterized protein [Nicotiana sylvestris]|uniref:uncharacterized protein n=1 Tax=Nicotiana sylvestris TaxID=4096 RepID=UPI00388C424B
MGGNSISANRRNHFWSFLSHCKLVDLGFKGSKYAWSNQRYTNRQDLILERLDRCLPTEDWIKSYPETLVTHLLRTHSDRCPLLLSITSHQHSDDSRPFRLEIMWCGHPDFHNIMHNSFTSTNDLLENTKTFKANVTTWNKVVFGNIFHKKKHILDRLNGIQKASAYPFSSFLQNLEANLQAECSAILQNEEDWKLKSRVDWLSQGDANTKFFHTITLNRRRRNKILNLTDEVGNQITNPKLIKEATRDYFKNIFTTSHTSSTHKRGHSENIPQTLTDSMRVSLDQPLRTLKLK